MGSWQCVIATIFLFELQASLITKLANVLSGHVSFDCNRALRWVHGNRAFCVVLCTQSTNSLLTCVDKDIKTNALILWTDR